MTSERQETEQDAERDPLSKMDAAYWLLEGVDVMGEVWEAGRAMGRREMDAEWRARVEAGSPPPLPMLRPSALADAFDKGWRARGDALLAARDREGEHG